MNQPLLQEAPEDNDNERPHASTVVPMLVADSPTALGATLKSMRELKRLSLNEVSGRVKFSVRQIEALENEQWELLPAGTSLRGFVKNYGRFLETDVDSLLVMLDNQLGSSTVPPTALKRSATLGQADIPIHADVTHRPWGWFIVILILLFVAGFYAVERGWIPDSWLIFDWLQSLKK